MLNKIEPPIDQIKFENVKQKETESKIIGSIMRTKGLKLFEYNILKDKLIEIKIIFNDEVVIKRNKFGKLYPDYAGAVNYDAFINGNNEHFEALNTKTAKNKIVKFKSGKLKTLNNLKPVNKNTHISIY